MKWMSKCSGPKKKKMPCKISPANYRLFGNSVEIGWKFFLCDVQVVRVSQREISAVGSACIRLPHVFDKVGGYRPRSDPLTQQEFRTAS